MQAIVQFWHIFIGVILVLSALGVLLLKNPVHASLSFLVNIFGVAFFFVQLNAPFVAVIQILIYAGAILVIFIFALVLFQDAYKQIKRHPSNKKGVPIFFVSAFVIAAFVYFAFRLDHIDSAAVPQGQLPYDYGTVEGLGSALYIKFFFPFEAVVLLFLIALVGSIYLAQKEAQ